MTPERWEAVKEVFADALAREEGARDAYLAARCGDDRDLLETVTSLLRSHAGAADFIETSPVHGLAADAASEGRWSGRTRGAYQLGRRVGAGGMGEVYESQDTRTGERVAIKVLTDDGAHAARRLKREARHALALDHPHVCRVHEVAEDDAGAFIAMEFIDGTVLSDALPPAGFDVPTATGLALQLGEAVAYAHAHRIIHRDLKSANLMVTAAGTLKVLDFGLARHLPRSVLSDISAASSAEIGVVAGTLNYLAPEVLRGERADARSDVWALGIVLHEMLTGEQPFRGRTSFELTSAVLREPAARLPPQVPAGLRTIRDNCLAKNPADRYQDGTEAMAALRAFRSGGRVRRRTPRRPSVRAWAVAGLLLVVAAAGVAWTLGSRSDTPGSGRTTTVAVLPLRDLAAAEGDEYFADGITEALIGRLGTIGGLHVISRASIMRYRDRAEPGEIRRDLGVDTMVRGSVERSGDSVRLDLELVDTATGRPLLRRTFDRRANEVLALQADAVRAIVDELDVRLSTSELARHAAVRAVDPVVYEAYLKGRFYWNKRTSASLEQAVGFFTSAIALDPTYAPARAALADCYNQLGTHMVGSASPADMRSRARAEAIAAIQADESLAEGHATLAYVSHYDWAWNTAEREFRRAIELNPNLAMAHVWYANYLVSRRRLPEAVSEVRRAEALDPFSLVVVTNVGWTLSYAGQQDEAMAAYDRALALDPDYVQARWRRAGGLAARGDLDDAIAEMLRVVEMTGRNPSALASLAQTYVTAGRRADALGLADTLVALSRTRYVSPVGLYGLYFALDDRDRGFAWLDKAIEERSNGVAYLLADGYFDRVQDDPRFLRALERVGLSDVR